MADEPDSKLPNDQSDHVPSPDKWIPVYDIPSERSPLATRSPSREVATIPKATLRGVIRKKAQLAWQNLRADFKFSKEAIASGLAEGWWRKLMITLRGINKFLEIGFSVGIIALLLGAYWWFIYPTVGKRWTAIFALSILTAGFLVVIRFTRRFYEKTDDLLTDARRELAKAAIKTDVLEQALAPARAEVNRLQERLRPRIEITDVFLDEFDGIGEDGKPDRFQLIRIELTSTEPTWAQVTVDKIELEGHLYRKLHLHIQHKPNDVNKTELLPGRPDYWDVLQKASRSTRLELTHVETVSARALSPAAKYKFRITAACDKGFGISKWMTIWLDENGDLNFTVTDS
jgi:hypothetical protein